MKRFGLFGSARDTASRKTVNSVRNIGSAFGMGWARLLRPLLSVALMVGASAAHAACTPHPNWVLNTPTTVALSGTYNVSSSAPNGTVIATFYAATIPGGTAEAECAPYTVDAIARAITMQPRPAVDLAQAIFESGVPGIGIKLRDGTGTKIPPWQTSQTSCANGGGCGNAFAVVASNPQFQVSFIKTGPVGSGSVNAADIPQVSASISSSGIVLYYLAASGSIHFTVPGCTVNAPTVPLGTHSVGEFTGPGYSSHSVDFNVTLSDCPTAGSIFYQLDSVNGYESLAQSIVKLQGGTGAASGIGVQVLNTTSLAPFPMGAPQPLVTGPSNFSLPFKARYYQMTSTVTTGVANAAIGITLTYN
ncbi:TPA: type 1 fimbrial protein [Pseudomonas putida]|nr:type 1 fimbrial protein [Pseudomonas putida]